MSLRVLAKQGVSYGVVGVLALVVDWSCFVLLTWCGIATAPANLLARLSGAGIAMEYWSEADGRWKKMR